MAAPKTTRLASTVVGPQPTVAGDAPADTWLASEQAHSVSPDKKTAALAGHLTVNAVVEGTGLTFPSQVARSGNRYEVVTAHDAGGTAVTVIRDYTQGTSFLLSTRANSTAITKGEIISATNGYYIVKTAGTTHSAAPTFNANVGGDISEGGGTVVWTRIL